MARQRIPGLSLAVLKEGKVIKTAAYGYANIELQAPATVETLYGLGSISKTFTAAAIMLLVENGQLGLDDKISKQLASLPPEWAEITVRHLLTHTSGIKEEVWKGGIVEFTAMSTSKKT
jgi:D-alanyl-D-alanine carboxypeptidase